MTHVISNEKHCSLVEQEILIKNYKHTKQRTHPA